MLNSDFKDLEVVATIPQSSYKIGVVTKLDDYEYVTDYKIIIPQEEPKQDYSGVHLKHCYQGEYENGCKFGDNDCPAKPLKPKQETIEEASWKYNPVKKLDNEFIRAAFIAGANYQAARMYSEDEVYNLLNNFNNHTLKLQSLKLDNSLNVKDWFNEFKKK